MRYTPKTGQGSLVAADTELEVHFITEQKLKK
jgi:hypothetical protein